MKTIFFIYISFLSFPFFGATLTVVNTNDTGAGSLRDQIIVANNGDDINFDPSLIASGSNTILLLSEIAFSKDITITGLYNASDTLYISGGNVNRIFSLSNNNNVVLDSLYLINGFMPTNGGAGVNCNNVKNLAVTNSFFKGNNASYPYRGGGIHFQSYTSALSDLNSLQVDNCYFYENSAQYGGGLAATSYVKYPNVVAITNSHFYSNTALYGGGMYYDNYADSLVPTTALTVANCLLDSNTANNSPGIYVSSYGFQGVDVIVSNCKLRENTSPSSSSVIAYYSFSKADESFQLTDTEIENNTTSALNVFKIGATGTFNAQILRSTFSNNTWNENIGLISLGNSPTSLLNGEILQTTVSGNNCLYNGPSTGTIHISSPSVASIVKIKNSTIVSNNHAGLTSAAIIDSYNSTAVKEVTSSILALNTPRDLNTFDTIVSGGYSIFSDPLINGSIASDQLSVDSIALKLSALAYNGGSTKTRLPLEGSLAINAGNPLDLVPAQNAPLTGIRDIGAAETTSTTPSSTSVNELENNFFQLSPNPSATYFNITSLSKTSITSVSIRNTAGQTVKQWSSTQILASNNFVIDELSSGLYYVSIQQGNQTQELVLKLIKQ